MLWKVKELMQLSVELQLNVEEYCGNNGVLPPIKRSTSRTVYVATFAKALSIIQTMQEVKRLGEIGLAVFDELLMLSHGHRSCTLEVSIAQLMLHGKLSFPVCSNLMSLSKVIQLLCCSIITVYSKHSVPFSSPKLL